MGSDAPANTRGVASVRCHALDFLQQGNACIVTMNLRWGFTQAATKMESYSFASCRFEREILCFKRSKDYVQIQQKKLEH